MRYNWVTGPSLPGSAGMGVNIPLDLETSVFSCLKSPKSTSVTRMVWAGPEDLGDRGVDNLSLQKAALWDPWGGTGRGLQIPAGIILSLSSCRKNIVKIRCLTSGFKPVTAVIYLIDFVMILCLCLGPGEHCLHCYVSPELLRHDLLHFTCSASFHCITSCWYFLLISINSDFHFGPTFPSFSTIFAKRINSHLLKLSKFSVSHLVQPECFCMWETRANSTSSQIQKKFLLYHIILILKRN